MGGTLTLDQMKGIGMTGLFANSSEAASSQNQLAQANSNMRLMNRELENFRMNSI